MPVTPREALSTLPSYAAGKPPKPAEGLTPYKLSSNENPLGPVPAVTEAVKAVDTLHRYPNPTAESLRAAIAETYGLDAADVVAGAGSLGALTQIINTFAGTRPDGVQDEVIYAWRSFEAYPIVVRTAGARDIMVPLAEDGRHDLGAMAAAITENTAVILLCTPNNPTGPALTHREVTDFLARVPEDVVVVIDEAYREFVRIEDPVDTLSLYGEHPNVAVLRTFSKAHGLATLRVGYSLARQEITRHLRTVAVPFAVSAVGEIAAVTSLRHLDEVSSRVEELVEERQRVRDALLDAGWRIPEAQGNFIWLPLGEKSLDFAQEAGVQALAVRPFDGDGVRVSIGEREANDRLIALCSTYTGKE